MGSLCKILSKNLVEASRLFGVRELASEVSWKYVSSFQGSSEAASLFMEGRNPQISYYRPLRRVHPLHPGHLFPFPPDRRRPSSIHSPLNILPKPEKSHIRFNSAGQVILHQDYWDSGGNLFEHIPVVGWLIRRIKARL